MAEKKEPYQIAGENWARYQYGIDRGHREYTGSAKFLEGCYLGGGYDVDGLLLPGGQWSDGDLACLQAQGRPAYEFNEIKPAIDAAIGYQVANRMQISFRPRSGDATREVADVRSKVAMQIADNNRLSYLETDVFGDGMIQQRGYYDVRMDFDDSILGEVRITTLDPMDVIPDPDAQSYDPTHWSDVIVTRFMTADEIEGLYGESARKIAEVEGDGSGEAPWGSDADTEKRNTFGVDDYFEGAVSDGRVKRYRVVDRQHWIRERMDVAISPDGDVRQMGGDETPEAMADMQAHGYSFTKRNMRRVRWTVTTMTDVLHDDWSPYDRLTVVPFFPYFRRGKTRGMVDNAVGPQLSLNKGMSQATHIINTTANSGYWVEQNSLTNMSTEDLEHVGAQSGLVGEYAKGSRPPEKIQPNSMPHGVNELIQLSHKVLQDVTVPDAMRGITGAGESGLAIQSRQHASQQILSVPLDNLSRTRHMLGQWIDYAISKYYGTERVFRITRTNPKTGAEEDEAIELNKFQPETGAYLNDMTAGEYDVVIADQPIQTTFDNTNFTQAIEMRKEGIAIPDSYVVKHSNLSDKPEIIAAMGQQSQPAADPTIEAKVALIQAQTRKTEAEAINKSVEGLYSATQAAGVIVQNPRIAPIADQMLQSAGFVDQSPPIIPEVISGAANGTSGAVIDNGVELIENTNPLTPANLPQPENPGVGVNSGIETQAIGDE